MVAILPSFKKLTKVSNLQTEVEFKETVKKQLSQAIKCTDIEKLKFLLDEVVVKSLEEKVSVIKAAWERLKSQEFLNEKERLEELQDFLSKILRDKHNKCEELIANTLWEEYLVAQKTDVWENMANSIAQNSKNEFLSMSVAQAKSDPIKRASMTIFAAFVKFRNYMEYVNSDGQSRLSSENDSNGAMDVTNREIDMMNEGKGIPKGMGFMAP